MPEFHNNSEEIELDASHLFCPECGCNDAIILRMPRPNTWFGATGRARCNHCQTEFGVVECTVEPVLPKAKSPFQPLIDWLRSQVES